MDEGARLGGISQGSAGVHRSPRISENTEAGLLSISRMCSNFVATGGAAPRTSALDWNISSATVRTCRRRQTARRGPS
jgi:hypothetical protein